MSQAKPQVSAPQAAKTESFKKKYKLEGMVASVIVMWVDYFFVHQGLVANDMGIVTGGMVVMLAAAAAAYYFG